MVYTWCLSSVVPSLCQVLFLLVFSHFKCSFTDVTINLSKEISVLQSLMASMPLTPILFLERCCQNSEKIGWPDSVILFLLQFFYLVFQFSHHLSKGSNLFSIEIRYIHRAKFLEIQVYRYSQSFDIRNWTCAPNKTCALSITHAGECLFDF